VNRAFVKRGLLARIPPTEELTAELVDRDTGQVVAVRSLMVQTTRRKDELRIMGGWITAKFRDEEFRNKGNRRLLYRWIATEPWFREEFAGWRMTGRGTQDAAMAWKDSGFFNATARQDQGELYNLEGIFPKWEQAGDGRTAPSGSQRPGPTQARLSDSHLLRALESALSRLAQSRPFVYFALLWSPSSRTV